MQNKTMASSVSNLVLNTEEISIKDESENESNTTTYRVKNYTQHKLYKKFSNLKAHYVTIMKMIALIILLIIAIIIIYFQSANFYSIQAVSNTLERIIVDDTKIMNYLILNKTNSNRNETINKYDVNTSKSSDHLIYTNFSQEIIIKDGNKLWMYNLNNESVRLLYQSKNNIESVEVYTRNTIYVSTFNGTFTNIISLTKTSNTTDEYYLDVIFEDMRVKFQGMAFDSISKNLYMVDKSKGTLIIFNVESKQFNILLSDLLQPNNVFLDSSKGKIFILQASHSILKGDMDGENLGTIVQQSGITVITLDRGNQRVYWVNELIGIESSDYEGKNLYHFATDTATILDLAVIDNHLFWLWIDHHHLAVLQLISCQAYDGKCEHHIMQSISNLHNPESIYFSLEPMEEFNHLVSNPCRINNGNCQHLCLANANAAGSCACQLGWQLNPDKKTCRETRDFILYAVDYTIRGRTLDVTKKVLTDVILPTPFYVGSVNQNIIIDYDLQQDICYFSDGRNIFQMGLKKYQNQTKFVDQNEYTITDLVYDWKGKHVYTMEYNQPYYSGYNKFQYHIKNVNVNNDAVQRSDILDFANVGTFDFRLAIYPDQNNIFYIAKENDNWLIRKMSTTLKQNLPFGLLHIDDNTVKQHGRPIAIDYQDHRLYWIYSRTPFTEIRHASFDGLESNSLSVNIDYPDCIFVYRQWLFLSNFTHMWRFNKNNGQNAVKIIPQLRQGRDVLVINDIRLISDSIQSTD